VVDNSFHFYIKRDGWPLTPSVGYCPGKKLHCPQCDSKKICIFFKPGFLGIRMGEWCRFLDKNNFELCDDYKIILKNNYTPNWVCKNCYNGGVIIK